jgi:hypothetical protein
MFLCPNVHAVFFKSIKSREVVTKSTAPGILGQKYKICIGFEQENIIATFGQK